MVKRSVRRPEQHQQTQPGCSQHSSTRTSDSHLPFLSSYLSWLVLCSNTSKHSRERRDSNRVFFYGTWCQVIFMKPSTILSDLQTEAYTTVHIVSVTQPPTLVLYCTTLSSVQCIVCVCAWSTDYEHERKQTLMRCTSTACCTVISVSSQDLSQMLSPFPKTKQCTQWEMKPHTHSELGSIQNDRQSCLLRHCGYSKLGPYLLRMKGNKGLCTSKL